MTLWLLGEQGDTQQRVIGNVKRTLMAQSCLRDDLFPLPGAGIHLRKGHGALAVDPLLRLPINI